MSCCRGVSAKRPLVIITNHNDSMNMIRHYDKGIQFNIFPQFGSPLPFLGNYSADGAQYDFSINHCTKQTFVAVCANGNKI